MISYYLAMGITIAIVVIFKFCFKKTFKKLSWKFLVWFLILSKIPDIISTVLTFEKFKYDSSVYEANIVVHWMQANTNLSPMAILLIHSAIVISFFLFLFRISWNSSKFSRATVKIFLLIFSVGSIVAALSNFGIYFLC